MCRVMLGWAYADDPRELASHWRELEAELIDHMASEEEVILPGYRVHEPVDAAAILDDHTRIRLLMTPIGIEIELHEIRAAQLCRLVDALDAHSLHEDAAMYPWAERNVPMVAQRMLFARVDRGFSRA